MEKLWKRIDLVERYPLCLENGDICYYAREFVSGGGFDASETNNLVSNFKKHPKWKNSKHWHYKISAAQCFAKELSTVLPQGISIALIPSSKIVADPEYDPRMDIMLDHLLKDRPDIKLELPFRPKASCIAVHHGGQRKVAALIDNLEWRGLANQNINGLVLLDDVITSGAHFKACQRIAQYHQPNIELAGLFWARTVWPD